MGGERGQVDAFDVEGEKATHEFDCRLGDSEEVVDTLLFFLVQLRVGGCLGRAPVRGQGPVRERGIVGGNEGCAACIDCSEVGQSCGQLGFFCLE